MQFANRRILGLLDILLDRPDATRPIVIIQADEGPFPIRYQRDELGFRWLEATDAELLQKFAILNAYLIPGIAPDDAGLYPTITPVNSFRVVFNAAFRTDFPLLADRNWVFVDQRHIYDLVDVTDRVPR